LRLNCFVTSLCDLVYRIILKKYPVEPFNFRQYANLNVQLSVFAETLSTNLMVTSYIERRKLVSIKTV